MKLRVTVEGKTYEVEVEVLEEGAPSGAPAPKAAAPAPKAAAPAPAPVSKPAPAAAPSGGGRVQSAPIAGTVRAVNVNVGDEVEKNQEILVLEAMKMETSVSSEQAGKVKAILISVGDAVQSGQALIEFE